MSSKHIPITEKDFDQLIANDRRARRHASDEGATTYVDALGRYIVHDTINKKFFIVLEGA